MRKLNKSFLLSLLFSVLGWIYVRADDVVKDKARELSQTNGKGFEHWEPLRVIGYGRPIYSVVYLRDGNRLAISGTAGTIEIRNTKTSAIELQLTEGPRIFSLSWSPDGSRLVSGSINGMAKVWDTIPWTVIN